jgi:hypothetical protein
MLLQVQLLSSNTEANASNIAFGWIIVLRDTCTNRRTLMFMVTLQLTVFLPFLHMYSFILHLLMHYFAYCVEIIYFYHSLAANILELECMGL